MNIKSSFQIRPPTPENSQFQELKTKSEDPNNNSKELENIRDTEPESPFDEHSSKQEEIQSDIQERKVDQISPALVNSDLHLQLSPSESEESSLPDLAGYERWHKGQKPKNGHSSDRCENNEDDIKSRSNEEISCESTNQATEVCKLNEDQYSTASENSRDEVITAKRLHGFTKSLFLFVHAQFVRLVIFPSNLLLHILKTERSVPLDPKTVKTYILDHNVFISS